MRRTDMKRRFRTKRILKWAGLAGCVLTALLFAATFVWTVSLFWWTDGSKTFREVSALPGRLDYDSFYDLKKDYGFPKVREFQITAVDASMRTPAEWLRWPDVHGHPPKEGGGGFGPIAGVFGVSLPLWLVFLVLAIPTAILWYRDRRPPKGHCRACGYNLTGNVSGKCPECGKPT